MSCVIPCCVHKGVCESSSSRCLQSSSCGQQTLQIPGRPLQKKPSLAIFPLFSCSFVSFLTPDRSFTGPRVPTNPTTPAKPQSDHRAESRVSAGLWLGFPGRIHRGTRDPFAAIFTGHFRHCQVHPLYLQSYYCRRTCPNRGFSAPAILLYCFSRF